MHPHIFVILIKGISKNPSGHVPFDIDKLKRYTFTNGEGLPLKLATELLF